MTHALLDAAQACREWLVSTRRDLHKHPELSLKEKRTGQVTADAMEKLGLKVRRNFWGEGFVADLDVPGGKGRIALRADMDALPLTELNDVPYKSCNVGVAHMCGHDTHMTMALGAARLLAENRARLKRSVRFLFQPSEETPPGGAKGMIAAGCLDGVDEVYGVHNQPLLEVGKVATRAGAMTAAADTIRVRLTGRGGHASRPHEALDPIPGACALVTQLQSLVSRRVAPGTPAVVSVTRVSAGTTHNIIPDFAELEGTVRTFDAALRDQLEQQIGHMTRGVAEAHGLKADYRFERGYDSIVNHTSGVAAVRRTAADVVGEANVDTEYPAQTWGEDFAYFLQHRPGAFFVVGSGNKQKGIIEPVHSPRFDVDETCLEIGAAILARLAMG
ncbi:MAG: amidohydrolase [Planctomycetes bacterium]|nr:amidohydrolase [Planctomycetota bacterium]